MTPLVRVTLAFSAGLVAGLLLDGRGVALLLAGALLAGVLLSVRAAARTHALRVALALFALLGAAAGSGAAEAARTDCRAQWRDGARVRVRAAPAALAVEGRATTFELAEPGCQGAVRVLLPRGVEVQPGQSVRLVGRWRRFDASTRWPVDPLRTGTLRADSVQPLPAGEARAWRAAVRARAQESLRTLLPRTHGLAEALVLAQRDALDPAVRDAFVAAGLAHLLSISGSHVGMLAGMLLLAFRMLRLPVRAARAAVLAAIVAYVLMLGAPAPAARAALQLGLVLWALLLQRPTSGWNTAAAAALLLLVGQPLAALEPGFQLSFAGVCGLIAYRRPIAMQLPGRLPRGLRDALAASMAATLTTAPIAALHFGQIAPIGIAAGLVATPLVALALPALALELALHPVLPGVAGWVAPGIELLLRSLDGVARVAVAIPFGHARVSADTLLLWLGAAAAFVVLRGRQRGGGSESPLETPASVAASRRLRQLRHGTVAAALAAIVAWAPALAPAGTLEIHTIDVGQGDAIAIRTPRGRWLLVDAGMRSDRWDAGRARVVPYLLQAGARHIDALVLTHAHADHIGGARAVLEAFDVGTVIDPATPGRSAQYVETLLAAAAEPARWVWPSPGSELILDGVRLRFLFPPTRLLDPPDDPNDYSLAFHLGYGRFGMLFLGDAPAAVEEQLVAEHGPALAARVLKVAHHGSATSSSEALLAAVRPEIAVVSVGRDNRYGHPAPGVLARLLRHHVRVLRTDERGSIVIRGWRSGKLELATQR